MLYATLLSASLVLLTVLIHFELLFRTSTWLQDRAIAPRPRVLALSLACLGAHFLQIGLYASAYYFMAEVWGLAHFTGDFNGTIVDYIYFSAVTYTSLGLGDVWPHGPVRLVTGIEALNGLLLIGWTIAFTYPVLRDACRSECKDG